MGDSAPVEAVVGWSARVIKGERCIEAQKPVEPQARGASLYDQIFKPSKFPANADFHLFKTGVEPKWEDPECANGGKWTVISSRKANLDTMWLETLMALIGEQFDEADEICGVVASVRQRQDKLALWTKTATNEATQMSIGRKWKEIIDVTDKIFYSFHPYGVRDLVRKKKRWMMLKRKDQRKVDTVCNLA
ncbi:eukaryotic initiation factor 4E protein [Actinidia rufa]|uniref:Eukaryotic translation initiation factor isoform 4E n=1 Tax=Actinidia rufa TaxID=165716 RepID=A0A7J0EAW3_9ERIC|nr:eukaryotic initiation factor 4E protein [Actinidia rufa]